MNLYIQVQDGQPINHPALVDHLYGAFGGVPDDWKPFIRVEHPAVGVYEVYVDTTYEQVGGYYVDVHNVRPMTDEEKAVKLAAENARLDWLRANPPAPNWVWNEEKQKWTTPPRPTTGGPWKFDMVTAKDWVIATEPPFPSWVISEDGLRYVPPIPRPEGQYRWDEPTLSWMPLNV